MFYILHFNYLFDDHDDDDGDDDDDDGFLPLLIRYLKQRFDFFFFLFSLDDDQYL